MAKTLHYDFLTNPTLTGSEHPIATSPTLSITRATKATMVDADGYIREVQAGEARFTGATFAQNTLKYSSTFDNAEWNKDFVTVTSGQADPDGGTNAYLLVDTVDNNIHNIRQDPTSANLVPDTWTFSVYAKANSLSAIRVGIQSSASDYTFFSVNLSTGASTSAARLGNWTTGTCTVTDQGDGWYRIELTSVYSGESAAWNVTYGGQIRTENPYQTQVYAGSLESVVIYGAQLERASSASTYIPTTTVAKSSLTGTSTKGLLVEEARTNICLQSEDFSTTWTTANATITTNSTTAPDGATTADTIGDDGTTGTGQVIALQVVGGLATSTQHTFSVFLKADGLNWAHFEFDGWTSPPNNTKAFFDLQNGVVGTVDAGFDDSGIEDYGNGWYRCWVVFTTDGTDTQGNLEVGPADADGDRIVDLDGTSSIFVWGAQLEASPGGPSSYIPTTTTSVTRNGDLPVTTDLSWYNIVEGSFYTKATYEGVQGGPAAATSQNYIFSLDDGTATDRIINWLNQATTVDAGGTSIARVMSNNSVQAQPFESRSSTVYGIGVETKSALGVKKDDFAMYIGGSEVSFGSPDTSGNMPQDELTTFRIGHRYSDDFHFNGHIAEIAYFNERLANATLADYSLNGLPTAFPGTVAGDGGHIWPARSNDPRWAQIITDSGITTTGNFIDDVHQALEAMASDTGAMDDLWKKVKAIYSITDTSEPFTY